MNLRHIEIFHAVYVAGSVTGAARALNVSQPSVTKMLRHAETLLGFTLFERARGRLIPTEDAHALFGDVAEIQLRVGALREATRNLRRGASGALRVGALPSLGLGVLPVSVAAFLRRDTAVAFELQTIHHTDILRALYERDVDLAIAYQVPAHAPVGHRWLGEGELVVLFRETDLPDAPPRLELSQLQGHAFVSLAQSGPIGDLFTKEVERLGLAFDEVVSARTFYIAAALVKAGVGMAVVDSFTAAAMLAPGLAYRPIRPSIAFDVHAMFLDNRPPSTLAQAFLDQVSHTIDEL